MIKMSMNEIAKILNAELIVNHHQLEIKGVSTNSNEIESQQLFIPLIGQRFDAHQFIEQVKQKNVHNTLWSKKHPIPQNMNVILVDDTHIALKQLAKVYLEKINPKVIGVTGSNGKTAIKDILKTVLTPFYRVHATLGNRNNDIGLPLTILEMASDVEVVILEMGMDHVGDIKTLVSIAPLDIAIISNIGTAHIVDLGSREGIARAKLEILEGLKSQGVLITNANEPLVHNKYTNTVYFDSHQVSNFKQTLSGITFDFNGVHIESNLFGEFQVENILACLEVTKILKLDQIIIVQQLKNVALTKMRSDVYRYRDVYIMDDSYKSNPESLQAALQTLSGFNHRKIVVLSDMLDLGENEIEYHQTVAKWLTHYNVDTAYFYGQLSKYSYDATSIKAYYFENTETLVKSLLQEEDCIILFKASRSMQMDKVITAYKRLKEEQE